MLAIRMQRTGRKGHAQFRVIVQDSHRTPTSGRIVAALGHYNPHTKTAVLEKEKATFYLEHGAQPSDRVARLLKNEGVKLPKWVKLEADKKRDIRNTEKLRKNRPADEAPKAKATEEPVEAPAEIVDAKEETADQKVTETAEVTPEAIEEITEVATEEDAPETKS